MIEDVNDPFGLPVPPRDRWGRPMLIPRGGSTIRVPYTRASSLANYISGGYGLERWRLRRLAKGMGNREDLAAMAAALPEFTNDPRQDRPTNTALDVIIADALISGGAELQANHGTAIHGFTDPVATGPVPARMADDVAGFWSALESRGIRIVGTEIFVANDPLMAAGTFDHMLQIPGVRGVVVGDKKTGELHGIEFGVQLYVYASGDGYNLHDDTRYSFAEVNQETAVIMHIPPGAGRTDLYWLDLVRGREQAFRAAKTRDDQKDDASMLTKFEEIPAVAPEPSIPEMMDAVALARVIGECKTRDELENLWLGQARGASGWTAEVTDFAQKKWRDLPA